MLRENYFCPSTQHLKASKMTPTGQVKVLLLPVSSFKKEEGIPILIYSSIIKLTHIIEMKTKVLRCKEDSEDQKVTYFIFIISS
jgi:hypothetical protein